MIIKTKYRYIFSFYFFLCAIFMSAFEKIEMKNENGVYTIPCEVNGLRLRFIFDTGASNVSISKTEASFMLKNGYLNEEDFLGSQKVQIANGSIEDNFVVNIRELKVGCKTINNIKASISSSINAPLLLGQSAISELGGWRVDKNYLIIGNGEQNAVDTVAAYSLPSEIEDALIEAERGNTNAQFKVAKYFYDEELYDEADNVYNAFYWMEKAANAGYVEAQFWLGVMYSNGEGIEIDDTSAYKWIKQSSDAGFDRAHYALGCIYENGYGVKVDYKKAFEYYSKAASIGNSLAMTSLGVLYEKGYGVNKNNRIAMSWYIKGAESGNYNSKTTLADKYYSGEITPKNLSKAFYWYENAINTLTPEDNRYGTLVGILEQDIADKYRLCDNHKKAFEWYKKAAEHGNISTFDTLGNYYEKGKGTTKDEYKAIYWYRKSAENGNTFGQYELGRCYRFGIGTKKNYTESAEWFSKSAEQGNSDAQFQLGWQYYAGEGVQQDYEIAFYLFKLSADQDNDDAQNMVGYCYYFGVGIQKDTTQAILWFSKAADNGNELAKELLDDILN